MLDGGGAPPGENGGGGLATLNGNLTIEESTFSGNSISGNNSNGGVEMGATERGESGGPFEVLKRAEMVKAQRQASTGPNYQPLAATGGVFNDVSATSFAADWITYLREKGGSQSCDTNLFCPKQAATKEWLDALITIFL